MSVRRNAFLVIQRYSLLLVSYLLIYFLSDNKINSLSLAGFNRFLSKLQVYLLVVHLEELTVFFLRITVFLLRLWFYYVESVC